MPPAVVFVEEDHQLQHAYQRDDQDDWPTSGESWDEELIQPGRLVYVGQGQAQFVRADEPHPGILWPKRKKRSKKKKKSRTPPPPPPLPPPPSLSPAPIDWDDWEELCQEAPPLPPLPPQPTEQPEEEDPFPYEPEDWEDEIACYFAAFHHQPEDWEAEIALFHHQPEDWEPELLF
jgi:hypothetical protein